MIGCVLVGRTAQLKKEKKNINNPMGIISFLIVLDRKQNQSLQKDKRKCDKRMLSEHIKADMKNDDVT